MRVSSCCGCWSVSAGAKIIGSLIVLLSVLSIILAAVNFSGFLIAFVAPVIHLVCGILLIIGAQNRESKFVFPILCTLFTSLILLFPVFTVHIIQVFVLTGQSVVGYIIAFIIIIISFALTAYFFFVINTFYKELLHEKYTDNRVDKDFNVRLSNKPQYQHA